MHLFYYSDCANRFFSHAIFALKCSTCFSREVSLLGNSQIEVALPPNQAAIKPAASHHHRSTRTTCYLRYWPLFPRRYLPLFNLNHHGKYYQSTGVVNDCCISHKFKHGIHISNKFFNLMQSKDTSFHGWWLGK